MADLLPNVKTLSCDDFQTIVDAAVAGKKVVIHDDEFDGATNPTPSEVASLYHRIEKPNAQAYVLHYRLRTPCAETKFLAHVNRLLRGELTPEDLALFSGEKKAP